MKNIIITCLLFGLILIIIGCSGCNTTTNDNENISTNENTIKISLNYQKSFLRSAGDISATTILETQNVDPIKIIHVADIIIKYLEENNIETLQREELINQIAERIPYNNLKNIAFSLVNKLPQNINLKDVKKLLIAYCKGMKIGAQEFNIEDKKN